MNAVVTITMGANYENIARMTHPSIRAYSERIGAEFIVIDRQQVSETSPHYEKFQIFSLLNKHERVIFVDTDAIVRGDCPSLFDVVPENRLGMADEGAYKDRRQAMVDAYVAYGEEPPKDLDGQYFNTGVIVASRAHKDVFRKPAKEIWNFYEQSYLNMAIRKHRVATQDIGYKFNRMNCMDGRTGEHRLMSYVVHYAGVLGGLDKLIPADLERWRRGEHASMRRHVLVGVGAKLGDNVCAEPVVRKMTQACRDARIVVMTMHPELFEHLPVGVRSFDWSPHGEDQPYIKLDTTMDEKDPRRPLFNPDHMHCLDYISILCMRRQLPVADRRIRLAPTAQGVLELTEASGIGLGEMSKVVLVHPGRSWRSKTFPAAWWEEVISGLSKAGHRVAVIGRDEQRTGVVDVSLPDGVLDLRNLLGLKGLIAAVSAARVLVTNDSAPMHVAGAFDNELVVIPTCKHPDLVLPWRNGSQHYKTKVLYKKLVYDEGFDPSWLGQQDMSCADPVACLPDPADVVAAAGGAR
jgi:hypothetical protein